MKEIIKRLEKEYKELYEKVKKLEDFIDNNDKYKELSLTHKNLLNMQFEHQNNYLIILGIRIDLLITENK